MTTNYARGAAFERRVKRELEKAGWTCFRVAGSHSVADIVAVKVEFPTLFVQVRTTGRLDPDEWNALYDCAHNAGVTAVLAQRFGKRLLFWTLDSRKTSRVKPSMNAPTWILQAS